MKITTTEYFMMLFIGMLVMVIAAIITAFDPELAYLSGIIMLFAGLILGIAGGSEVKK